MTQIATSIEQSSRLVEAGLDMKSADMRWFPVEMWDNEKDCAVKGHTLDVNPGGEGIPAWSLSKLWDMSNVLGLAPQSHTDEELESSDLISVLVDWIIKKIG